MNGPDAFRRDPRTLLREYRPTMDRDVVHLWAQDAVPALRLALAATGLPGVLTAAEVRCSFLDHAEARGLQVDHDPMTATFLHPDTRAAWEAWRAAHIALGAYVPKGRSNG